MREASACRAAQRPHGGSAEAPMGPQTGSHFRCETAHMHIQARVARKR